MTPIVYVSDILKDKYPFLLKYNPFYYFIKSYQDIFLYSKAPESSSLIVISIMVATLSLLFIFLYKKIVPVIKDIL